MPQINPIASDRSTWFKGQRVLRKNTEEAGTVVNINGHIKVKWDSGRTSYFRHGDQSNVRLQEPPQNSK